MKRFWLALLIAVFFYTKIDILIWQRIFEENQLTGLGIGVYQWGWLQSLFGFMTLGILVCYPDWRRMVTFPVSTHSSKPAVPIQGCLATLSHFRSAAPTQQSLQVVNITLFLRIP